MNRVLVVCCFAVCTLTPLSAARAAAGGLIYAIDFPLQAGEPVAWLQAEGFELKLDAQTLATRFTELGLMLETDGEDAGLFIKALELPGAKRVRVTWGVDRFPVGVDWDHGKRRVALAVMFWLGTEKIESGAFYVPDSPYFTGLFLGNRAQEGKAYTGKFYKKGGRYFCQPCSARLGETVVTEFDLEKAFKRSFGKPKMPPLTAFGFQVNTKGSRGGSRAFLKRVEFLAGS